MGRALSNESFQIKTGLREAWNNLSPEEKKLIAPNAQNVPNGEEELELYHRIVSSCIELNRYQNNGREFLTKQGIKFPNIYSKFLLNVAIFYFNQSHTLPDGFLNNLINLMNNNIVNVATLNYDKLLYSAFFDRGALQGYNGNLVDGFQNTGFRPDNLERHFEREFGWYLHLHGSPLFYSNENGIIFKSHIYDTLQNDRLHHRNHFVLTHSTLKPEIITKSMLLSSYWDYFNIALNESSAIILFGYGGTDKHINQAIMRWWNLKTENKKIIIVTHDSDSLESWKEQFDFIQKENLLLLSNILEYNFIID